MCVYGVIPTFIFIKYAHINKNVFIYIYAYLNIFTDPIIEILIDKNKRCGESFPSHFCFPSFQAMIPEGCSNVFLNVVPTVMDLLTYQSVLGTYSDSYRLIKYWA